MMQPADYSEGGPGSSTKLQLGWDLDVTIAIILIIAYVPPNLCWPAPARLLLPGHFDMQLSPLPSLAPALQSVRVLAAVMQIITQLNFYCL